LPRLSSLCNRDQWEEFCQVKVILHISHQSIQELIRNNTISWSTLFNQHIDEINNDLNDLLEHPIDNEEEITNNDSQEELNEEDDKQEEYHFDWMRLAKMSPNRNIDSSIDLDT